MENENMKFYKMGREVPAGAKKPFNNGKFSGTDINPMWRIKTLTEMFGPAGIGWYTEVISERYEEHFDTTMAIIDINLYIKVDGEWSKPIFGTGGNALVKSTKNGQVSSDEGYKMAYTDALSVACKALGIGADVYYESDKTKYTKNETPPEIPKSDKATPTQVKILEKVYTGDKLTRLLVANGISKLEDISREKASSLIEQLKAREARKEATA